MSAFFKPGTPGFHVAVMQATSERAVIVIDHTTPEGEEPRETPIYWGNGELGTLTEDETLALDTLLPAAIRKKPATAVAPEAPEEAATRTPGRFDRLIPGILVGIPIGMLFLMLMDVLGTWLGAVL